MMDIQQGLYNPNVSITPSRIQDGDGSTLLDILDLTNSNAAAVAIVDGSGNQIVSFGGGTQYTEADTDASITGTAVMWEDAGDTLRAVSSAKPLPVNVVAGATSGTEYTEADIDASITGTAIMWEDAADTLRAVSSAKPLPVSNTTLSVVGGGAEATALRVTIASDSTGVLSVDDNGASLTIDNAALSVTGGGVEAGALRVTIANDSTGVVSIDDNGGSLTVDGSVTVSATNLDIRDLTQASDNVAVGDGTNLIEILAAGADNVVNTTNQLVTAAILYAYDGATFDRVTNGGGTEATALRVTIASDSTGVLSIDDNGSSITVDGSVSITGSVAVTNAGTFAVQESGAALTALQLIDDPIATLGTTTYTEATTKAMIIGVIRRDADTTAVNTDNEIAPLQVDASGYLKVNVKAGSAGATEYTEDAVAPADPQGGTLMMTRDDQLATLTEVEGDWTRARATAKGALWVALADSAGDPITSFGGGTQYTEDAAAAADPTGTALIMVRADSLAAVTSTDGDNIAARATNKGELYVKHVDTIAVTQSGTWDEVGINDSGNSITVDNGTLSVVGGGTEATALRVTIASDSTGVLSIDDNGGSLTVDNGGTFAVQESGAALTALQLIDDGVYTDDTSTHSTGVSKGYGIMAVAVPTDAAVTANDFGHVAMTTDRKLHVAVMDALPAGTNNIGDVDVLTIAAGDNNIGNVDIVTMPNVTLAAGTNTNEVVGDVAHDAPIAGNPLTIGAVASAAAPTDVSADQDAVRVWALRSGALAVQPTFAGVLAVAGNGASGTGVQRVTLANDSTGIIASIGTSVTPGTAAANLGKAEDALAGSGDTGVFILGVANEANSTRAGDGDYIGIATDTEGNTRIVGNRDHDAVDAGEVVGVGGRAIAHGTNPTAVAAADRTVWFFNRAGVPFVIGGHPNVVTLRANYTAANTDAAIVTIAGGLKIVVTRLSVTASNANSVNVSVVIGFGAATTPSTTGVVLAHPNIAAGSGVVEGNGSGILGVGADGEDLRITSSVPTSGSIDVVVSYYTIES